MIKVMKLSEEDVKMRYITPAIEKAGWNKNQIRCEYTFTAGRIFVRKNIISRGKRKRADYVLFYKTDNIPLAIIEAKDESHSMGSGLQQAVEYANALDISYVYSSNGTGFIEQDLINGTIRELTLDEFPSPQELYERYVKDRNITENQEKALLQQYFSKKNYKSPRYYQRVAIDRVVNAIARGDKRVLLVSATGTGKTFMIFQIIHRLKMAGIKKRILFLADRNVLVDQTISGDFKPFEKYMTKVTNKTLDSSYEVYLALYQQLMGEEGKEAYLQFKPNFFDLVVIDECHRGSAREDSEWRKILDYFSTATHFGCTATPIETNEASSSNYFGEPVYEYSLKQGINDGFLAPYKVIRIGIDKDLVGYRPEVGKVDKYGNEIEDREYNIKDYDRNLVLEDRTKVVAKKITEFLKKTDRFSKTIVFCVDTDHADRMKQALINENKDLNSKNNNYIVKITGDEPTAKEYLESFIDEEEKYPVIAVTSKLMTTGVDAKMCKLIVLDSNINSMTEFKQIVGRGTRLLEEKGKTYFTIMDFRNVSKLFADPEFDGNPEDVKDINIDQPVDDEFDYEESGDNNFDNYSDNNNEDVSEEEDKVKLKKGKYYVDDVKTEVISEQEQYIDKNGKLVTENFVDLTRKCILNKYANLDYFLNVWTNAERKQAIIDELIEEGIILDDLKEEIGQKDIDDFDLICHLAYDKKPLTKRERANNVKKRFYLYKYSDVAQKILNILLEKYATDGIKDIEDIKVLKLPEFKEIGAINAMNAFGGREGYEKAIQELKNEIYSA